MGKAEVIGLGRSGIAAARVLNRDNWDVTLSDAATFEKIISRANGRELEQSIADLQSEGIKIELGHNVDVNSSEPPDLIVVSPGVPWDIPSLQEARKKNIDTIGEIELAWRYLKDIPWVGITGTNGKTTTTALIAQMFKSAGLNAPACGNIGYAACELVLEKDNDNPYDWIIAELSSYQIESSQNLELEIGIWTTFTPDHLKRHYTLENYFKIKASIFDRTIKAIYNGDDPYLRKVGSQKWQEDYWTSINGKDGLISKSDRGIYIEDDWVNAFGELILPVSLFKMPGLHNRQNLLLAIGVSLLAGIDKKAIAEAITTFPGVPHRLEYVLTYQGVDYINDSKATNYEAAEVGLASVASPVILIAGGQAKEGDDLPWLNKIEKKAAMVLLIGEAADRFARRLEEIGYENYEIVETMENAVTRSAELAEQEIAKVVLLSPACASFDRYLSFEHRGDSFKELCQNL